MWEHRAGTPPVPASQTLLNNHGGDSVLDTLFVGINDSSEYYHEQYDSNDTLNNLPVYTSMGWPTNTGMKPLHVYPPHDCPPIMESNSSYSVPTYDPNSPLALSTPTSPPSSNGLSPATVPSPISPQPSPPAMVPHDIRPLMELKKVKVEATDCEQWENFIDHEKTYYGLYNNKQMPISSTISLRSRIIAENLEYHPIDNAYILYRQNQLKVEIDFVGGLGLTSYNTKSPEPYYIFRGSRFFQIEGLYFHMYSVKHIRGQPFDPEPVEINQSRGSRLSKDNQAPGYSIIENGRGSFPKLQFKAATANNARSGKSSHTQPSPQQQYYRIVVALVAKVGADHEYICTNMSPCFIVRGQNPKRFRESEEKDQQYNAFSSPSPVMTPSTTFACPVTPTKTRLLAQVKSEGKRPEKEKESKRKRARRESDAEDDEDTHWSKSPAANTICVKDGKVGINTSAPPEALSVIGNIILTGSVLKPSDQRIKTNIQPVSAASQLDKIKQIKIYDYELKHGKAPGASGDKERGLLAQELKEVLPNATRTINNVTLADGQLMEELIVVDERALLYENIGATQELSDIVKHDQKRLLDMGNKIETCLQVNTTDAAATQKTLNTAGRLMEYIITERNLKTTKSNSNVCCVMVTHTNKGFYGSLFGLGPAWTLFYLGFFLPIFWAGGILFLFSHNADRKLAGIVHFVAAVIFSVIAFLVAYVNIVSPVPVVMAMFGVGSFCMIAAGLRWNYRRKLRHKKISYQAESEKRSMVEDGERRPEYILQLAPATSDKQKYMSIPMDVLPSIEQAVETVTAKPSMKSIIAAARAKNASFAEEEWERNYLVRNAV